MPTKTKPKKRVEPIYDTREAWLNAGVKALTEAFSGTFEEVFGKSIPAEVAVTCGFPLRERGGKVIGQCWKAEAAEGVRHIFITPRLDDVVSILATLLHELIHATDENQHSHRGLFLKAVKALGLAGKPTATYAEPGSEIEGVLKGIAKELGAYPHNKLNPIHITPQKTYMLKVTCPKCENSLRATFKNLDLFGLPFCGTCTRKKKVGSSEPPVVVAMPVRMVSEEFDVARIERELKGE